MPGEVDRLLFWMDRVERLEADLQETHPAMHGLIRAKLESAKRTERAAFEALISAARCRRSGSDRCAGCTRERDQRSRLGQNALGRVNGLHRASPIETRASGATPGRGAPFLQTGAAPDAGIPPFN